MSSFFTSVMVLIFLAALKIEPFNDPSSLWGFWSWVGVVVGTMAFSLTVGKKFFPVLLFSFLAVQSSQASNLRLYVVGEDMDGNATQFSFPPTNHWSEEYANPPGFWAFPLGDPIGFDADGYQTGYDNYVMGYDLSQSNLFDWQGNQFMVGWSVSGISNFVYQTIAVGLTKPTGPIWQVQSTTNFHTWQTEWYSVTGMQSQVQMPDGSTLTTNYQCSLYDSSGQFICSWRGLFSDLEMDSVDSSWLLFPTNHLSGHKCFRLVQIGPGNINLANNEPPGSGGKTTSNYGQPQPNIIENIYSFDPTYGGCDPPKCIFLEIVMVMIVAFIAALGCWIIYHIFHCKPFQPHKDPDDP